MIVPSAAMRVTLPMAVTVRSTSGAGDGRQRTLAAATRGCRGQVLIHLGAAPDGLASDAHPAGDDAAHRFSGLRMRRERLIAHALDDLESLRSRPIRWNGFVSIGWHLPPPRLLQSFAGYL